ncbi:MAG: response regulator [Magnetococcales bacterium]|nr:response regulator [Magnetococcales bacterium]
MGQLSSKPRILIVDDSQSGIDMLRDLFSSYVRLIAMNGEQALRLAASDKPPDLILLDVMMPDMDGFEVCKRLKANPATQEIPVIFVTAKGEAADERHGLSLGAVDYIVKPCNVDVIRQRAEHHLRLGQEQNL